MGRKSFLLRIDSELWRQVATCAAENLRSVNAEVEWLLREALRGHDDRITPGPPSPSDPEEHGTH